MKTRYKCAAGLFVAVMCAAMSACSGSAPQAQTSSQAARGTLPSTVIWWHSAATSSREALRTALSSGLVTHVLLKSMHRFDMHMSDRRVTESLDIIREYKHVKLIWGQSLWPYYRQRDVKPQVITDPDYYVREIREILNEKKALGADFTLFDSEPYGETVLYPVLKGKGVDYDKLYPLIQRAVRQAVEKVGKVDYVLPSGMFNLKHPYVALAELGEKRIAEMTYYDNPRRSRRIKFPYDIPGFSVKPHRENKKHPGLPFFTPEQIFHRRDLWERFDAIFIYHSRKTSQEVAQGLVDYARKIGVKKP